MTRILQPLTVGVTLPDWSGGSHPQLTYKACVISELVGFCILMPQRPWTSKHLKTFKAKALKYLSKTHKKGHKNLERKLEKELDY